MAYETGTSSSIQDLMQKLSIFLVANGWTQDFATTGDPGLIAFSKNSIFVAFQYTEATDGGTLAIYQNFSNDDPVSVWLSTGDSGVGAASLVASAFDTGRSVNIFAGPHAAYHFFEQNAAPAYCHIVVEVDTNRFRHFGFGEIEKIGDWQGGEYSYGHNWRQAVSQIDAPTSSTHTIGLESNSAGARTNFYATMHVRDQPEQAAADRWALIGSSSNFPVQQDRAGNDRLPCQGGSRGGMNGQMTPFRLSQLTAFKPLIPIVVHVADNTGVPDTRRLLGTHPDVRVVNIANLDPGETFVIAGETWFVFPWVRKQFLKNDTEESWNGGLAYRQELA